MAAKPEAELASSSKYTMTSSFRLLVIADVGGAATRHIGDEAMLEANLNAFRRLIPDVAVTVVSRDPAWTVARYGVDAVAPVGFPGPPSSGAERQAMLDELLSAATIAGRKHATIDAVSSADGVVVSGGGNLSSSWPDLLYERAALLSLARIFGKPVVVLGQTIGPILEADERPLLAATLSTARFVGLRELPSVALALELGVAQERVWYQCDDALFAEWSAAKSEAAPRSLPASAPVIAVTIDPQIRARKEPVFDSLVSQLRKLSETTGTPLLLVPHVFGNESAGAHSDQTEASVLAERLRLASTIVATGLDADHARKLAGEATMIISSRYHPIVFALGAGVPAIGIYGDDYCRVKVQGALAHAGLDRWTVTYHDILRGELLTKALTLWQARSEVRRQLDSCRAPWREESRERWAAIIGALDHTSIPFSDRSAMMFGRPLMEMTTAFASTNEARLVWQQAELAELARQDADGEARASWPEHEGLYGVLRRRGAALRSKLRRSKLRRSTRKP